MKKTFTSLLAFSLLISLHAQTNIFGSKRYSRAYFRIQAGINFNTTIPSPLLDGQMPNTPTPEAASSISDVYGRILFYTDGHTVWNACGEIMPNGTNAGSLRAHSSTQGALITPFVGDDSKYYVLSVEGLEHLFTNPAGTGLRYSVADMCLDIGKGDVDTSFKSIPLLVNDSISEKLTAIKHANGTDYWILTRLNNGSSRYAAFLVDSNGINTTPVYSNTGFISGATTGYLKANLIGDKIVAAHMDIFSIGNPISVELSDFNNSTGIVSNTQELSTKYRNFPYGVEFSPNDTFAYITVNAADTSYQRDSIFRYNVYAPLPQVTESFVGHAMGSMMLTQDGKIYITDSSVPVGSGLSSHLSVIANPNSSMGDSINAQFLKNDFFLGGPQVGGGITNMFIYHTNEDTSLVPPNQNLPYGGIDSANIDTCIGQSIQLGITSRTCRSYSWDRVSGNNIGLNDTTLAQPLAFLPGTYEISVSHKCNTYLDTVIISSGPCPLPIDLLDFTASVINNEKVKLDWEISDEAGLKNYQLEHSKDAKDFKVFADVATSGSGKNIAYEYYDEHPYRNISYYRLRMVKEDNTFSYSEIEQVYLGSIDILNIYPNPAEGEINIVVAVGAEMNVNLSIVDPLGKEIEETAFFVEKGSTTINHDVSELASGMYIFKLSSPTGEFVSSEFIVR